MRNNNWTNRATRVVAQVCREVAQATGVASIDLEHMSGLMPYEIEACQHAMRLRTWMQRRRFRREMRRGQGVVQGTFVRRAGDRNPTQWQRTPPREVR